MRSRVPNRVVVLALVFGLALFGACGDDDDGSAPDARGPNPTGPDPGPNPTADDPGPNPTAGGPVTVDGTLQITAKCLTMQQPQGSLDLRFDRWSTKGKSLADDTGTVVAHDGDHIAVAGHERSATGDCGTRFDVENLVTVLPR